MRTGAAVLLVVAALVAQSASGDAAERGAGGARAKLALSRQAAPAGTRVRLWGRGFPPRARLVVRFGGRRLRSLRARRSGSFSVVLRIPSRRIGPHLLTVRGGGRLARIRFRISRRAVPPTAAPSQPPPDSAPAGPQAPPPPEPDPVTLTAAGDIACRPADPEQPTTCRHARTAQLVQALAPDAVATLGDGQYEKGLPAEYAGSFAPTWGLFRELIRPAPGNHEYLVDDTHSNASGHFGYFGEAAGEPDKGYYSYPLGLWQAIVLNTGDIAWTKNPSNPDAAQMPDDCFPISCAPGSAQEAWLRQTLAALPPERCVVAYWHHPRYSSGSPFDNLEVRALYDALYDHGAELVLTGHTHSYERFAPMDADGAVDAATGVRQFVVGTGGKSLRAPPASLRAGSEHFDTTRFGVLELTLSASDYAYRFVDEGGVTRDQGSGACHGAPTG